MTIRVEYFGQLATVTDKREELREIAEGATLRELLHDLADTYGRPFAAIVTDTDGNIRPSLLALMNGAVVDKTDNPVIGDGSSLKLLSAIAGG